MRMSRVIFAMTATPFLLLTRIGLHTAGQSHARGVEKKHGLLTAPDRGEAYLGGELRCCGGPAFLVLQPGGFAAMALAGFPRRPVLTPPLPAGFWAQLVLAHIIQPESCRFNPRRIPGGARGCFASSLIHPSAMTQR